MTDVPADHVPERYASPARPGEGCAAPCMAPDCPVVLMGSTIDGAMGALVRHMAAKHPELPQPQHHRGGPPTREELIKDAIARYAEENPPQDDDEESTEPTESE